MARDESNREDLLREATALVERIELVPRPTEPSTIDNQLSARHIVAGFRANGAFSVFFADDPVYQFNAAGELRRAYCDGLLFKAVHRRLVSLERVRSPDEVQLLTHELSIEEQDSFLARASEYLRKLADGLDANSFAVTRQVPDNADVLARVWTWLAEHQGLRIAARPNA